MDDLTSCIVTFEPLSASQRTGATIIATFGSLSTVALALIVLRTIRLATAMFLRHDDGAFRPPEMLFFRTQLGHYAGCLILSNLLIGIAGLIDFVWVSHAGLSQGPMCSAQAALMQIGIWGTCSFTIALGVHTLVSYVFHIRPGRWRSLVAATIGWTIALVAGLVPLRKGDVYGPIGPSCGITPSDDIFALEALPIILAVFVSTVAYSVVFIVSRGMSNMICTPNRRGEDRSEEYPGFISKIVWPTFWFPLAFVLLLLPFCVTRIIMFAGHAVSFTSSVSAEVCVSMLGFVNACLLWNTFRVIDLAYRGRRSDSIVTETVKTFGNDASSESPIAPPNKLFSQPTTWPQENSHQLYRPTHPFSNHSRGYSWASVDSNTELLDPEKTMRHSVQKKVDHLRPSGVTPPLALGRRPGGNASLCSATLDPPSGVSFMEWDIQPRPSIQGRLFQPMAGTNAPSKDVEDPVFRSKAPPALDLSHLPNRFPPQEITRRSATRLGTSAVAASVPSRTSVVSAALKLEQGYQRVSVSAVASVPRVEVNTWSPGCAGGPKCRPTSPSPSSDSESIYSGETTCVGEVRSLPQVPELDDDGQDIVVICPSSRTTHAWSQRESITTVWSQETGDSLGQPDAAALALYPQPMANLLAPSAILRGRVDVGGMISRQAPLGPRSGPGTPYRAIMATSKLSAHVSQVPGQ